MKQMINSTEKRNYVDRCLICGAGLVGAALLTYFCLITVYSSDDYWYSTFWNHGLTGYLELMELHYQTMNGRVLVHVAAHLLLACGNWAFAAMCCGICLLIPAAAARQAGLDPRRSMTVTVFFLFGILLMPRQILNQGVLWISASCNYLLPSALICLMAMAVERGSLWAWPAAFICGATTEQMGLTTVLLGMVYFADALVRKTPKRISLGSVAAAAVGVVTIFLSPATGQRASEGVRLNSLGELIRNLEWAILNEAQILTENPLPLVLMLLYLVLAWNLLRKKTAGRWPHVVCALGCIALALGSLGTDWICTAGYIAGFGSLAVMAAGLILNGKRFVGALTLASLASAAVMLVTNTIEHRVMLPFYFLMLLCVCLLGGGTFHRERLVGMCAVLCAAATAVCLIPAVRGYWYNHQVDRLNKSLAAEAKETGCMRYCTDYDRAYTWLKADHDPYFRIKYLESEGLPENMGVIYFSRSDPNPHMLYAGDTLLTAGVMTDEQGCILLPLRQVLECLGGSVEWQQGTTMLKYGQTAYEMTDVDERTVRITWTDDAGQQHSETYAVYERFDFLKFLEMDFFTQVLEIPILRDDANFCYTITP